MTKRHSYRQKDREAYGEKQKTGRQKSQTKGHRQRNRESKIQTRQTDRQIFRPRDKGTKRLKYKHKERQTEEPYRPVFPKLFKLADHKTWKKNLADHKIS